MNSPFTKPGCDCTGCKRYGEHPRGFVGFHYITMTTMPVGVGGRQPTGVSCRCGFDAMYAGEIAAGKAIAQHRADNPPGTWPQ